MRRFVPLIALLAACATAPAPKLVAQRRVARAEKSVELPDTAPGKTVDQVLANELGPAESPKPTAPAFALASRFPGEQAYAGTQRCSYDAGSTCSLVMINEAAGTRFSSSIGEARQDPMLTAMVISDSMRGKVKLGEVITAGGNTVAQFDFSATENGVKRAGRVDVRRTGDITIVSTGVWTFKNRVAASKDFDAYVLRVRVVSRAVSK